MDRALKKAIAATRIIVSGQELSVIEVPTSDIDYGLVANANPFALLFEGEKTTVVIPTNRRKLFGAKAKACDGYNVILFDAELPMDLVGYFAEITRVLASVNVTVLAFSSYSHDYVLVRKKDAKKAVKALNQLVKSCSD
ncbi:ACT domain-containing protein [Candidatus Woesearchaeota archaeon]|nr:ACT domain-containing protein [Candidatus Woesearchaeota archaeon]